MADVDAAAAADAGAVVVVGAVTAGGLVAGGVALLGGELHAASGKTAAAAAAISTNWVRDMLFLPRDWMWIARQRRTRGAVPLAPARTLWAAAHCGQQRRHELLVVTERRPQPGGHLIHDTAQSAAGGASRAAATRVLLQADDEGPHIVTMGARTFACLKVVLRPPAGGVGQRDWHDIELAHVPGISGVASPRLAVAAQP